VGPKAVGRLSENLDLQRRCPLGQSTTAFMPNDNVRHNNNQLLASRPQLLRPVEVARLLSISLDTLARWRIEGRGPRYVKLGVGRKASVRYPQDAVDAFLQDPAGDASSNRGGL